MSKNYCIYGYQYELESKGYTQIKNQTIINVKLEEIRYLDSRQMYSLNKDDEDYILVNKSSEEVLCKISEFIESRMNHYELPQYNDIALIADSGIIITEFEGEF